MEWDRITRCRDINGLIVRYDVRYQALPSGGVETAMVPGVWDEGGEATLTGLTPFTSYSIEVAAVNNQSDVGEFSEPVIAQTYEDSEAHYECMWLVVSLIYDTALTLPLQFLALLASLHL